MNEAWGSASRMCLAKPSMKSYWLRCASRRSPRCCALPAEEILATVGNAALDFRLAGRVGGDGGVHEESAVLGVFEEDAIDSRRVAIWAGDDGLEIVSDEAVHDAAKEAPGGLQSVEHGREILAQRDGEKRIGARLRGYWARRLGDLSMLGASLDELAQ